MNNKLQLQKKVIRTFVVSCFLTIGLSDFQFRQARGQVIWRTIDTPKGQTKPVIWESTISDSEKPDRPTVKWEVPEPEAQNQPPSILVWEVLEAGDEVLTPASNSVFTPPSSLEEAEALLDIIPLKPSDYQPLLRLSPLVSTAETLPNEQRRIAFGMISLNDSSTAIKIIRSISILALTTAYCSHYL